MSNLYYLIHQDNNKDRVNNFYKIRRIKYSYMRTLLNKNIISEKTYEELMDILHEASLDELKKINLQTLKNNSDVVNIVRNLVEPKPNVKKRNSKNRNKKKLDNLYYLTPLEKQELKNWIRRTRKLYRKLIIKNICTVEELEAYNKIVGRIESPIEAERLYLELCLTYDDKYERVKKDQYCSQCPHCEELKNKISEALTIGDQL